jgi:hypothetical protein
LDAIKNTLTPEEYTRLRKQIEEGGFSGLEDMAKRMQDQASLQDRINRTLTTFANIWESLQGTLTQLAAVIGELVAPSLKALMDTLNNFVGKLINFVDKHKTVSKVLAYTVGGFVSFLAVLGVVGIVLASITKLFAFAFSPFVWLLRTTLVRGLTAALFQNTVALIRWAITGTASTGWLKALDFFLLKAKLSMLQLIGVIKLKILALRAMAIAWLTSPIGLIIAGISTLIGIGYLLYRNWDKIVKALATAWSWLKSNWQKLLQIFLWVNPISAPIMALNKLVKYVFGIDLFPAGKKIVESLWNGIKSLASKPVETMKEIVQKIRNMLPFSPAKEGPLRDIHRIKLIETIAQSINPAPLVNAIQTTLSTAKKTLQLSPLHATAMTTNPNINIVVNLGGINISGKAGHEEVKQTAINLEKEIRSVLEKISIERFRRQY